MIYDVVLRIEYLYESPAADGRHLVRLLPADIPGQQRLIAGHLHIEPEPAERTDRIDFFGNGVTEITFRQPHDTFVLRLHARVDRNPEIPFVGMGAVLAEMAGELAAEHSLARDAPAHFMAPSVRVQPNAAITAYARAQLRTGMTAAEAVRAIGAALHRDMRFDPDATSVDTPAAIAFAARRGVCQDFTHIMITCLRAIGVPAGYVSGFLRTLPPPGKPRLEGADAMHAWVRAWCGRDAGWIEYDPTNGVGAGPDHIKVASGRDYFDVSPVKGVMLVWGGQKSKQSVDVIPLGTL